MRIPVVLALPLLLGACASTPTTSGFLSGYEGMADDESALRAAARERRETSRLELVKRVAIVPLEVIVRNVAAGSLSKRLGLPEGTRLKKTVLEFCYKDDELGDPMVNDYHIAAMGWATEDEMKLISAYSLKVNEVLGEYLSDLGIALIDFKLEFGRLADGTIVLADEISPDTCRFWDTKTGEKLDKDRFRRDMGGVEGAYQEMLRRLLGE